MTGGASAIRYRPWQSLVLVCLSAVVAGTAIMAPLYDRALQQAMVSSLIAKASPDVASVTIRSAGRFDNQRVRAPYATSRMLARFPESVRPFFQDPISTIAVSVVAIDPAHASPVGSLMNRDGMCSHVEFAAGSCPSARDQIAISTDDAEVFGWSVGDMIHAEESSPLLVPPVAHVRTLEVVGIYSTDPDQAYWVARPPVGRAGLLNADGATQHDGWLTAPETLARTAAEPPREGDRWEAWAVPERTVDLLLDRDEIGVDELFAMADPMEEYLLRPVGATTWRTGATAQALSGIPDLTSRAETGRDHAHQLVPLFVVQLALLAALVLWLVMGVAVEQRRPEVAVVRMRGGDARSCRRQLMGELGPPILFGWMVGLVIASVAVLLIGRQWLDPDLQLEITPLVALTAAGVLVVEVLMLLTSMWSTVTANASDLLRRVRPRTGWAVSLGPALLVVMCGAIFAATATDSLNGWVATAAPTLLAIGAGLLLAFLLGPVAGRSGSRLLAQGRLVSGLGLLQLGRRTGMRTAIASIVAAAALLAFAVNALGVGERNRSELARATVGAPTVIRAGGTDIAAVRAAVRELDPSGEAATVAAIATSVGGGPSTMAVIPEEFARVAAFSSDVEAKGVAAALRPSGPEPIEVHGTHLTLDAVWASARAAGNRTTGASPVDLGALVVPPQGEAEEVSLEPSRPDGNGFRWRTDELPCAAGCLLTALVAHNRTEGDLVGIVTIRSASVEGSPLALGLQGEWTDATLHSRGSVVARDNGMAFRLAVDRGFDARIGHLSVPDRIPAVTTGELPPDSQEEQFAAVGLDGILREMEQVQTEPYLPGAPAATAMVNLDVLERDGAELDLATRLLVYLGPSLSTDAATQVLRDHGVAVEAVTRIDDVQRDYERSASAWALQLGVVAAGTAALLAALVLALAFITSWPLRSADVVALRLNGVSRRRATFIALLETVPLVLFSVVIGIGCGLIGSRIALPDLPFFDTPPTVPVEDLRTSWRTVLPAGAGLLVALTLLGTVTSLRLGRRSLSHASEEL
jgi:hypothetical protein